MNKKKQLYDKQNEYNRQKYNRIGLMVTKEEGELWRVIAQENNMSLNALIRTAVNFYISEQNDM